MNSVRPLGTGEGAGRPTTSGGPQQLQIQAGLAPYLRQGTAPLTPMNLAPPMGLGMGQQDVLAQQRLLAEQLRNSNPTGMTYDQWVAAAKQAAAGPTVQGPTGAMVKSATVNAGGGDEGSSPPGDSDASTAGTAGVSPDTGTTSPGADAAAAAADAAASAAAAAGASPAAAGAAAAAAADAAANGADAAAAAAAGAAAAAAADGGTGDAGGAAGDAGGDGGGGPGGDGGPY